ncbi:hypothetical protein J1N35_039148 [Gossypium stocksii]|uniref:RNase H type-1 domain-containing protein n=1 Tax=Gossypium stocksii TaxID=47602 RepID=A0A9D3ZN89_9ROSI|nr:hypothetical protein J1N35_039148 [Gossypium stocksii]
MIDAPVVILEQRIAFISFVNALQQQKFGRRHLAEYEGVKEMKSPVNMNRYHRAQDDISRVTIFFDAVFDRRNFRSATGLVGWDQRWELLVLKSTIHNNISPPFAAEAYACLEGTRLGKSLGVTSVKIMGDAKTIFRKCQANITDKSVRTRKHIDSQKKLLLKEKAITRWGMN